MATIAEVKHESAQLFAKGDAMRALRLYNAVIEAAPLDFIARMRAADCLHALGHTDEAISVYRAVGFYCLKAGHPLTALVCARVVSEALGGEGDDLLATLVVQYGSDSELIGKFAARLRIPPGETEVNPPDLRAPEPADFATHAATRAQTCTDSFNGFPEVVHPIPLLSEVSEDSFRRLLSTLVVRRLPSGAPVIREGEPGQSFFFVASGGVRVFDTDSVGRQRDLATLHENSVFGEMALLSAQPRSASVSCVAETDLLEVGKESIATLADELPAVASALHQFTLERLLANVMNSSPLFKPFTKVQQRDLLRRFTSHDVAPGTDIIHEGEVGRGLFVVLSGEVEVSKSSSGEQANLATLRPGDVFGEMSLIRNNATTATVTAARPSTVLFLAGEYVQRMVEGIPQIKEYLEALADDRALDTQLSMGDEVDEDPEDDGSIVILF